MSKNLLALLFGITMIIIAIALAEIVLYQLNELNHIVRESNPAKSMNVKDEALGYAPAYGTSIREVMRLDDGTELYSVNYTIDEIGRRQTTCLIDDSLIKRDVLFFGGSFTFGMGVEDDETLPYYYGKYGEGCRCFNYGFPGYGPQQVLEWLKRDDVINNVDGEETIFIYTFIDVHLWRLVGSMLRYTQWMEDFPNYILDEDGSLRRHGSFKTGRPIRAAIYKVLGKSHILRILNIEIPLKIGDRHLDLFCEVISESKRLYKEKFNSDKFIVLIYPQSDIFADRLILRLKELGIDYIDYSGLKFEQLIRARAGDKQNMRSLLQGLFIPVDNHPTGKNYDLVAERLAKDIKEFENQE